MCDPESGGRAEACAGAAAGAAAAGGWGRLHWYLSVLLALPVFLTGMYCTNYVFLAADVPYRCLVPECEQNVIDDRSKSLQGRALESDASAPNVDDVWSQEWSRWALLPADRCRRPAPVAAGCTNASFDSTTLVPCEEFVYQSQSSIVAEFNLGCQQWKRTLVGTVHNVGMLISLPIIGYVSDSWGRRTALVVSGFGVGVLGVVKSFSSSYWMYTVSEALETVLGASVYPAAFVLLIEWLGVEQRILTSLVLGLPLAAGSAALAALDRAAGHWRLWARVAYPPSALLLLYPWLLPDSARWLASKGRTVEAVQVIKWALKWNGSAVPEATFDKILNHKQDLLLSNLKTTSVDKLKAEDENLMTALFKYGELRRRLAVCGLWWASAVFVFYGLAVRAAALAGDRHLNYALLAAMEVVALLLNTLLLDRIGRRPLLRISFVVTGLACSIIPFLPEAARTWGTALYLCGKIGATMSLNALYVYTAEVFPTRARHRLLAACSMLGRVGSILAPLTPLLAVHREWAPTVLFGALPLLSAALTLLMPETLRAPLPDALADLQRPAAAPAPSPSPHAPRSN